MYSMAEIIFLEIFIQIKLRYFFDLMFTVTSLSLCVYKQNKFYNIFDNIYAQYICMDIFYA